MRTLLPTESERRCAYAYRPTDRGVQAGARDDETEAVEDVAELRVGFDFERLRSAFDTDLFGSFTCQKIDWRVCAMNKGRCSGVDDGVFGGGIGFG